MKFHNISLPQNYHNLTKFFWLSPWPKTFDQPKNKLGLHNKAKTLQQAELISRLVWCEDEGAVGPRGAGRRGAMEFASFSKYVQKTTEPRDLQGKFLKHVPKTTKPRDLQDRLFKACPEGSRTSISTRWLSPFTNLISVLIAGSGINSALCQRRGVFLKKSGISLMLSQYENHKNSIRNTLCFLLVFHLILNPN